LGSRRVDEGTGAAADDVALEKHARSEEKNGRQEEEERQAAAVGNVLQGRLLGPLPLVLIFAAALWVTSQIFLLETDIMIFDTVA